MIVLDTHAWLWWASDPSQLGRLASHEIDRAKQVGIPAICCLEVAGLAARGRIELNRSTLGWLRDALGAERVELLPLTPAVAVKAVDLRRAFPGDPADRLIVATAILESGLLVTKDERIRQFAGVRTVWG